jgi:hypothetical protein
MLGLFVSSFLKHLSSRIMLRDNVVSGPIKLRYPPSNDGYLVFLYEQTLVFEMRNQSAVRRVGFLGIMVSIFKILVNFSKNSHYLAANRTIRFEAS